MNLYLDQITEPLLMQSCVTLFVSAIEYFVGIDAGKGLLPMQTGDILATWVSTSLLERLMG